MNSIEHWERKNQDVLGNVLLSRKATMKFCQLHIRAQNLFAANGIPIEEMPLAVGKALEDGSLRIVIPIQYYFERFILVLRPLEWSWWRNPNEEE